MKYNYPYVIQLFFLFTSYLVVILYFRINNNNRILINLWKMKLTDSQRIRTEQFTKFLNEFVGDL